MPRYALRRLVERLRDSAPCPLVALDFPALIVTLLGVLLLLSGVLSEATKRLGAIAFSSGLAIFIVADLQYMLGSKRGRLTSQHVRLATTPVSFWLHIAIRIVMLLIFGGALLIGTYEAAA
jgi:hypothetical protein